MQTHREKVATPRIWLNRIVNTLDCNTRSRDNDVSHRQLTQSSACYFFLIKDTYIHTRIYPNDTLWRMNVDNPFIEIFKKEASKRQGNERWDFYYFSEDFSYKEDGECIRSGIKLNCKIVPRLYCCVAPGSWQMKENIVMIKDIGIDEARTRKGYFTHFVTYLLTLYDVVYLESVQPKWFNDYLSSPSSKWIRQGDGPWANNYIRMVTQ